MCSTHLLIMQYSSPECAVLIYWVCSTHLLSVQYSSSEFAVLIYWMCSTHLLNSLASGWFPVGVNECQNDAILWHFPMILQGVISTLKYMNITSSWGLTWMYVVIQHTSCLEVLMFLQAAQFSPVKWSFQNNGSEVFDSLSDVMKNIC